MNDDLNPGEPHPAAREAFIYVCSQKDLLTWQEAFASCAIEGNRLAEVCLGTLNRIMRGEPVSDRYILGLAWAMAGKKPSWEEE